MVLHDESLCTLFTFLVGDRLIFLVGLTCFTKLSIHELIYRQENRIGALFPNTVRIFLLYIAAILFVAHILGGKLLLRSVACIARGGRGKPEFLPCLQAVLGIF
jgi:hypothetical protein